MRERSVNRPISAMPLDSILQVIISINYIFINDVFHFEVLNRYIRYVVWTFLTLKYVTSTLHYRSCVLYRIQWMLYIFVREVSRVFTYN